MTSRVGKNGLSAIASRCSDFSENLTDATASLCAKMAQFRQRKRKKEAPKPSRADEEFHNHRPRGNGFVVCYIIGMQEAHELRRRGAARHFNLPSRGHARDSIRARLEIHSGRPLRLRLGLLAKRRKGIHEGRFRSSAY